MISYTIEDYFKLKKFFPIIMGLREESAEYKLITKEKYHKHDKLFREILNNKKEIVKLINKYITPQAKITKEEIRKIEEILIERKGDEGMLHAQMVIRRDFERAKEEGRKEGKLKNAIEVAKNMLKENVDIDFITRVTGLKKEQFMQ